jgi:hypothetical protein
MGCTGEDRKGGNLVQAGAPSPIVPYSFEQQLWDAGLARESQTVGTKKVSWWAPLWNALTN